MTGNPVDVLIVEDESIVALDIRETLLGCGYNVVGCAASGEEAVLLARKTRPHLVLMDIRLQGAMDGLEAARIIRETCQVPSVFLTSHADGEMLQRAKDADALGYLLKPFDEKELHIALEMALHRAAVEKGLRDSARPESVPPPSPDGDRLHLLTLGCIEVRRGGNPVARAEDLSQAQRELLAILVAAPQCKVSRQEIQLALWPDSSPEKARSNFDSLLLRLRKTLEGAPCIVLQKGILSLENCRVDAIEFVRDVKRGLKHLSLAEYAEAEKDLSAALRAWNGPFLLGAYGSDVVFTFHEDLTRRLVDAALGLSEVLAADARFDEAVAVVDRALAQDRTNDTLVRRLCRLLAKGEQRGRIRQVLRQYRESLHLEGYSDAEVTEILSAIPPAD